MGRFLAVFIAGFIAWGNTFGYATSTCEIVAKDWDIAFDKNSCPNGQDQRCVQDWTHSGCWRQRIPEHGMDSIVAQTSPFTFRDRNYMKFLVEAIYTPPRSRSGGMRSSHHQEDLLGFPTCGKAALGIPNGEMSMSMSYDMVHHGDDMDGGYDFSYSYSYSYSMSYDQSYMYLDNEIFSVTSLDVYVCSDIDTSASYGCDPTQKGSRQCWEMAENLATDVLIDSGFGMFCSQDCLFDDAEDSEVGSWCNIFGLRGCTMCANNCKVICDPGNSECDCVQCPSNATP